MNGMPRAQLDNERRLRLDEPVSGGESWREAVGRVMSFLEELTKEQEGRRVVLIGQLQHAGHSITSSTGSHLENL